MLVKIYKSCTYTTKITDIIYILYGRFLKTNCCFHISIKNIQTYVIRLFTIGGKNKTKQKSRKKQGLNQFKAYIKKECKSTL